MSSRWEPAHTDATEGGTVVRTEEMPFWSLITLERDCHSGIPFAITCGIYSAMVHTVYRSNEADAAATYDAMKLGLERLADVDKTLFYDELSEFVERFPT
ncbi:MAG: hypothetical protein M3154_04120 [Candidatus Eremiobacteraeota bacterium]|nr:hypothetical protein [Candidatus Eremiobacteraeota bacterium]